MWPPRLGADSYSAAGEEPIHRLSAAAGFGRFRRVAATPFTTVYEARH